MNNKVKNVFFDISKNSQFTPTQGFKTLTCSFKTNGFKIIRLIALFLVLSLPFFY